MNMENLSLLCGGRPPLLLLKQQSGNDYFDGLRGNLETHRSCPDNFTVNLHPGVAHRARLRGVEITGPGRAGLHSSLHRRAQQVDVAKPAIRVYQQNFKFRFIDLSARCQHQAATIAGRIGYAGKGDGELFACDSHDKGGRIPSQQKRYPRIPEGAFAYAPFQACTDSTSDAGIYSDSGHQQEVSLHAAAFIDDAANVNTACILTDDCFSREFQFDWEFEVISQHVCGSAWPDGQPRVCS